MKTKLIVDPLTGNPIPTADTDELSSRVTALEDKNVITTRFASVSSTTGTVTLPANSTVRLDDFGGTTDAIVTEIASGRPTNQLAYTAAGNVVTTTFDALGNFVLSGVPAAYPVAVVYRVVTPLKYFSSADADIVGDIEYLVDPIPQETKVEGLTNEGPLQSSVLSTILQSTAHSLAETGRSGMLAWSGAGNYWSWVDNGDNTGTFTLLRGGEGYIKYQEVVFAGNQTVTLSRGEAAYLLIDTAGLLQKSSTNNATDKSSRINLFLVQNDANGEFVAIRNDHKFSFDNGVRHWTDEGFGLVCDSLPGACDISRYGTGTGASTTDRMVNISAGKIIDADIEEAWSAVTTGITANHTYVNAGGLPVRYSYSKEFPMVYISAGVATAISSGNYGISILFLLKSDLNAAAPQFIAELTNAQYTNETAARTAISNGLYSFAALNKEHAQVGYVIVRNNVSGGYVVDVIRQKTTLRSTTGGSGVGSTASNVLTSTTNFNGALSASDTTVQAALDALDDKVGINALTEKMTPVDADMLGLMDSAASNALKKLSFANLKSAIYPVYDARSYASLNAAITAIGATSATLVVSAALPVTTNVTVPANVQIEFLRGGSLSSSGSVTVTMNGSVEAGPWKIFGDNVLLNGAPKQTQFNLRWWGAVGDNSTSDTTAFSRALTAMNAFDALNVPTLFIPPGLYVLATSTTALTSGVHIRGVPGQSVLKPSANAVAIQANDVRISIEGIYFYGNSGTRVGTGLYIDQRSVSKSPMVINCRFGNLQYGVYLYGVGASQTAHQGSLLNHLEMNNCLYGVYVATRAEYVTVNGCDVNSCGTAIYCVAGNLHVAGCNLSDNTIGIELASGDNDSHGSVVGCAINHCTTGVKIGAITAKSHKFVGCDIVAGALSFTSTGGVLFDACQITTATYSFDGADGVTFKDCVVDNPLSSKITAAANGNASFFSFVGCRDIDGKTVEGFYAFNGGIVYFVPSSSQTVATGGSAVMQFTVYSQATPFNPGQTKYALTSGSPATTFVNRGLGNGKLSISLNLRVADNAGVTDWTKAWMVVKIAARLAAVVPCKLIKTAGATYPFFVWSGTVAASAGENVTFELNNYTGQTLTLDGNGGWECFVEGL